MKNTILMIALTCFAFSSCKKDTPAASLEGKWRMILVKDNSSNTVAGKPPTIQGEVEITFNSISTTAGTFTGNTPTNDIWQNDYSVGANQTIAIPNLSITKVSETSWGMEFVDNIRQAEKYSFGPYGKLSISTKNKNLVFKKL